MINFLSAVLLMSDHPEQLAEFYRNILRVPLKPEKHGETDLHFGCELGDVHFAVHGRSKSGEFDRKASDSVRLAFVVFDINEFVSHVRSHNVQLLYPPRDEGFAVMTALLDPDGNHIEITCLADRWYQHLEQQRAKDGDLIQAWKRNSTR